MAAAAQLHRELFRHAANMSQKLALMLDMQMLSFAEVLYGVQVMAIHLVKEEPRVKPDEIVYQMLQRSIELPIGYFAILTAGGVYCALDPTDLSTRNEQLIDQTGRARCIIVQEVTNRQISCGIPQRILINRILTANLILTDEDLTILANIIGKRAFITCTSGTTAKAKVIVHTHESTLWQAQSYHSAGLILNSDTITAWASSSFIIHLIDFAYTWPNGASLLLLKEDGHMDIDYLTRAIDDHQATYILTSPIILQMLTEFFHRQPDATNRLSSLRILSTAGETLKTSILCQFAQYLPAKTEFVNLFGQSECQCICTYRINDLHHATFSSPVVPIGCALPGCTVVLVDEQGQLITTTDTIGELFVAGPGLFQEYLNEPQMTTERFSQIADARYVRTGDIQKWDMNGNLVQISRIDYQIQLRGQRLEPAEIEDVIMNSSPDVHESLVMKVEHDKYDYLIAYLAITVPPSEEENLTATIEKGCALHLSPIKCPTMYHIWHGKSLPRSRNGKIERAALPAPTFSTVKSIPTTNHVNIVDMPTIHIIQHLWKQTLLSRGKRNKSDLPLNAHWYQLGGDSLGMIQLISLYRSNFISSKCELPIGELLERATIHDHVNILSETLKSQQQERDNDERIAQSPQLKKTGVIKGPINSFWKVLLSVMSTPRLQSRSKWDLLNVVLVFSVSKGIVSIRRLKHALHLTVKKHATLHSSVGHDPISNDWVQQIEAFSDEGFSFVTTSLDDNHNALEDLIQNEYSFGIHNVSSGRLVRLHIVHESMQNSTDDNDAIFIGDVIIINIRHEAIDGTSISIFFNSLTQAYSTGELSVDPNDLTYLDYLLYVEQVDLSPSFAYWNQQMATFDFSRHFERLPHDHPYILGEATCNLNHILSFQLDAGALQIMSDCASANNVTLASVCAACHAAFLFELTDDWDVAFETTVASRPQEPQAVAILGNFFYLPLMRIHLEKARETTFVTLLQTVQSITNNSLLHARAQWSPVGNSTLKQSEDGTSVYYPITSFQFEQYQKDFVLDTSSTTGEVVLEYVHNKRDSLLAGLWARAAGRSSFFTEAFYIMPDMRLTFGMFFSTVSYDRSTSELLCKQFQELIHRIFVDVSVEDQNTKPLSDWLQPKTRHGI